jgi:cell shape-determining protein MreD
MPQRSRSHLQQQGITALNTVPSFVLLMLTLLAMTDLPIPLIEAIPPFFPVIAIYFFASWQPRYLPYWAVFGCGLLYDAFQITMLATYALLFMVFRFVVVRVRDKTGFADKTWYHSFVFAGLIFAFFVVEWMVLSLQLGFDALTITLIKRDVLTILLYPLLHLVLSSMIASLQSRSYK